MTNHKNENHHHHITLNLNRHSDKSLAKTGDFLQNSTSNEIESPLYSNNLEKYYNHELRESDKLANSRCRAIVCYREQESKVQLARCYSCWFIIISFYFTFCMIFSLVANRNEEDVESRVISICLLILSILLSIIGILAKKSCSIRNQIILVSGILLEMGLLVLSIIRDTEHKQTIDLVFESVGLFFYLILFLYAMVLLKDMIKLIKLKKRVDSVSLIDANKEDLLSPAKEV